MTSRQRYLTGDRSQRAGWRAGALRDPTPSRAFYRDGCCRTGSEDLGSHTICAVVTAEFLDHQRRIGNDLVTPDAPLPVPRPDARRPLVRDRIQLAAGARGRGGRVRRAGVDARTGARHRPARRAGVARRRRAHGPRHARRTEPWSYDELARNRDRGGARRAAARAASRSAARSSTRPARSLGTGHNQRVQRGDPLRARRGRGVPQRGPAALATATRSSPRRSRRAGSAAA